MPSTKTFHIGERSQATILAALTYYRNDMDNGCALPADVDPDGALTKLATRKGKVKPLSVYEIDTLCAEFKG